MSTISFGGRLSQYQDDARLGFSKEASATLRNEAELNQHFLFPLSRQSLCLEFYSLYLEWKNETKLLSSVDDVCSHPAYQRIIGMGVGVLPFIFSEMQREPNHWFWALKAISGADPINPEHRGIISKMTNDWLDWAKVNGYVK